MVENLEYEEKHKTENKNYPQFHFSKVTNNCEYVGLSSLTVFESL